MKNRHRFAGLCLSLLVGATPLIGCGRRSEVAERMVRRVHLDCPGYSMDVTAWATVHDSLWFIYRNELGQRVYPSEQCTHTVVEEFP